MGGYQQIFGGSAVYPSNQTYAAITLSADTNLAWPIESVSTNVIVADLIDITPINQNGWNLILPDATGGSTGVTMIVNNLSGTYTFNVQDNASNQVVAVTPGSAWLIYLVDNSTQAGVWRTLQYGAQAGSVNVAAIAGSGLVAIGTSLNQSMPVVSKSTNYTASIDDRARVILWTGAAGTLILPSPSGVGNNWFINVVNQGSGSLSVVPTTGLIDGTANKTFTAGTGTAIIFTDGNNYYTLGYGTAGTTSGFDYTTINCAGSDGVNGVITLSGGQLDRISYKCFGILTGTRTIVVPSNVQQYWIDNETTSSGGPYTLSIRTSGQTDPAGGVTVSQPGQAIMYCDGQNVRPAQSGIALPLAIGSGGTGATNAASARSNLGASTVGEGLFTAPSPFNARSTVLGSGTTGDSIFVAPDANTVLNLLAGGTLTGNLTISGTGSVGTLKVTASTPLGAGFTGLYLPAANQLGFVTNNVSCGSFDSSQNLNLVHPLALTQGGTGSTSKATAAVALGTVTSDTGTPNPNTLVLRDGSGYINSVRMFANFFNMSGAVDNATALDNVMFNANADGYIRRTSLAHFASIIGPLIDTETLTAGANGTIVLTSGLIIKWGGTGDVPTNSSQGGLGFAINFPVAFPTNCWVTCCQETEAHLAGSAQAATHVSVVNRFSFKVYNNSNGTQAFYYIAIGN